jgi:hypothetical protein
MLDSLAILPHRANWALGVRHYTSVPRNVAPHVRGHTALPSFYPSLSLSLLGSKWHHMFA